MREPRKQLEWEAFDLENKPMPFTPYTPDFRPWALRAGDFRVVRTFARNRSWQLQRKGYRLANFISFQSAMRAAERKAFAEEPVS